MYPIERIPSRIYGHPVSRHRVIQRILVVQLRSLSTAKREVHSPLENTVVPTCTHVDEHDARIEVTGIAREPEEFPLSRTACDTVTIVHGGKVASF
jgi:hypothetical protein